MTMQKQIPRQARNDKNGGYFVAPFSISHTPFSSIRKTLDKEVYIYIMANTV